MIWIYHPPELTKNDYRVNSIVNTLYQNKRQENIISNSPKIGGVPSKHGNQR